MNYLQDKKNKKRKYYNFFLLIIILFLLFYFSIDIFNYLSPLFNNILRPVFLVGKNINSNFSNLDSFLKTKKNLLLENQKLKLELNEILAKNANYETILEENKKLKEILERKDIGKNFILAVILSKPNKSPYDTFLIDIGAKDGIQKDALVFALGNIVIGKIGEVYKNTSKVILFSSPSEKTEIIISGSSLRNASEMADTAGNVFIDIKGRGGGNFEMIIPRDFILEENTEVVLPGVIPYVVGIVKSVISDPRDSLKKALLVSPINIFELKFVQVEK